MFEVTIRMLSDDGAYVDTFPDLKSALTKLLASMRLPGAENIVHIEITRTDVERVPFDKRNIH
jgi:hypothetical protein